MRRGAGAGGCGAPVLLRVIWIQQNPTCVQKSEIQHSSKEEVEEAEAQRRLGHKPACAGGGR